MPMRIASNEKFACFALTRCWLSEGFPEALELGPNLWTVTALDLKIAEHWAGWLGSITMDELREASLVLYTTIISAKPQILDDENEQLTKTLDYILYGLLLQGVPVYFKGFSLKGANVGGDVDVRQFSQLKDYPPTYELPEFRPGARELEGATVVARRLRQINEGKESWARIRRGLRALFQGSGMSDGGDRLHQFVRALEALVRPDIGNTRKQFAHRIDQTFVLANAETRDTLLQIFDLRSHVEHVHSVLDALGGDEKVRIATANRRTRQVDVLARFALRRVLESDDLFNRFKTEAGIEEFWQLPDADRVAAWGDRLDLGAIR